MGPKQVYILSDDPMVRETLSAVLEQTGYEPVCFADSNALLIDARHRLPTCILLDVPVPEQGGLQVLVELKEEVGSLATILVMSGSGNTEVAFRAGKMGAADFIGRPFADGELIDRVNKATADQSRQHQFTIGLNSFYESASLTKRQREIFDQMLLGKSTKDIAFLLKLSPRTVEDHRANILDKANVRSTVQLWAAIWELGRNPAIGNFR